ncbi:T9SS type A sorting domain-containing protein [Aquimarina sp. RZ0]|nr:T9SS type A sorting domain-containing protein [Aquimarina sp. RZ0]
MQGNTRQNINIIRLEKNKRVAYLMFDLSSVNGTIKEASLNFTVNSDAGNGEVTIYKGNNNNWTEQNLSNNNKPAKSGVLGSINSTYAIGNTKTVSLQPASISGNKVSFILEAVSGNDFAFASKEHGSAAKPELVLTYEGTRRENNELINSFEIYPNPTEDIITFTSDMTNKRIKLYDMLGRLQRNIVFKKGENTLDLSVLESGYYLLNILDTEKSNEVIATKKLIKQ